MAAVLIHGLHGVADAVLAFAFVKAADEAGFYFTASAQTPHGTTDFVDEMVFGDCVGALVAGANEIARGEDAPARGFCLATVAMWGQGLGARLRMGHAVWG